MNNITEEQYAQLTKKLDLIASILDQQLQFSSEFPTSLGAGYVEHLAKHRSTLDKHFSLLSSIE